MQPAQSLILKCEDFLNHVPEQVKTEFTSLKRYLCTNNWKLAAPRNIIKIYALVPKIATALSTQDLKDKFIEILQMGSGRRILRVGAPDINLDFSPLINFIEQGTRPEPFISFVNKKDPKEVKRAAEALDRLSEDNLGRSFGQSVYERLLMSDTGVCLTAEDDDRNVIGCLFGTLVVVNDCRIFHFWTCARQANYPGISLVKEFAEYENVITDKFNADFLSLRVDIGNDRASALYRECGYSNDENYDEYETGETALYMFKDKTKKFQQPAGDAVTKAVTIESLKTLGWTGVADMVTFVSKILMRNIVYN